MDEEYDVIIVGASITGLCMANYLAKKGIKILIIDLKNIKRIGESVSDKIITENSVLFLKNAFDIRIPVKFIEKQEEITKISSINEVGFELNSKYYIVNKKQLAAYLIGKILDFENVTILERNMIEDLIIEERKISGLKVRDMTRGTVQDINCKIIVDASGSTAVIRRKLPVNRFFVQNIEDFDRAVIYEETIQTSEEIKNSKIYFDPTNLNSGHVWLNPLKNNKISLGMTFPGRTSNIKTEFEEYKKALLNTELLNIIESKTGVTSLRRPLNSFVYKNILLVGSSACQTNPIIIRDFSFALKGAYYASKAITNALKYDIINTQSLWQYNIDYMKDVGAKSALLEVIRDFFASLSTESFEFILDKGIISKELIENIDTRIRKRDIIFSNAKLLLHPNLLNKFMKLSQYSTSMKEIYENYPNYDDFAPWKTKLNKEIIKVRNSFLV